MMGVRQQMVALVLAVALPWPARTCMCCSSYPCPYAVPKGQRSGCWTTSVATAALSGNGSQATEARLPQPRSPSGAGSATHVGSATAAAGQQSEMGWYSPSSTLSTVFDEGLCLVPADPSLGDGGVRGCIVRPSVTGPSAACSRAWETNPLQEAGGIVQSSVSFHGKVGQLLFGLHNVGAGTAGADVGATQWQFAWCADGSGLFAGTAGNWDQTFTRVSATPPSASDVLKIAFNMADKTARFYHNEKKLHEASWASLSAPGEPAQFYAHVALQSNSVADPKPKGGGPPYTGKPNDKKFIDGAVCALRGDDSWEVDGDAWIFLTVLLLGATAYLAGGVALGKARGCEEEATSRVATTAAGRMLRRHPHWRHWCEGSALVRDGTLFLAARARGQSAAEASERRRSGGTLNTPLHSSNSPRSRGGGSVVSGRSSRGSSSSKKSRGSSKPKSDKKARSKSAAAKTRRESLHGKQEDAATPDAAAVTPEVKEWKPTRTGHLAVGARETGVKVTL